MKFLPGWPRNCCQCLQTLLTRSGDVIRPQLRPLGLGPRLVFSCVLCIGVAFREWVWLSGSADILHTLTVCGPSPDGEEGCLQEEER